MLHLIPKVKKLEIKEGYLLNKAIFCDTAGLDERLVSMLGTLPADDGGPPLVFSVGPAAQAARHPLSVVVRDVRSGSVSPRRACPVFT